MTRFEVSLEMPDGNAHQHRCQPAGLDLTPTSGSLFITETRLRYAGKR